MPKFKRISKTAEGHKFELEEDFTITPRFDKDFWGFKGIYFNSDGHSSCGKYYSPEHDGKEGFSEGSNDYCILSIVPEWSFIYAPIGACILNKHYGEKGFIKIPEHFQGEKKMFELNNGRLFFYKAGRSNGLTCHRDHSWALKAAHCHDILLMEGYDSNSRGEGATRDVIDRVFLSVLLDHVDTLTGFKKALYKSFAYAMYWAVRANSNVKSWFKG